MTAAYNKELPGADLITSPPDLQSYKGQAWDIRISIGDAPLAEAFIFSMDSLDDAKRSIGELLEKFALNPARAADLDLDYYPELPFLQQELLEIWQGAKEDAFELTLFINQREGAVQRDAVASDFLSACTFRNKSWDYLVLDIIFSIGPTRIDESKRSTFIERYQSLNHEMAKQEVIALAAYDKFASVAVAPCALGVPDGFDLRLQMAELDGIDSERYAVVQLLAQEELSLAEIFEPVCEVLSQKTHFTGDVLEQLKTCGQAFEAT